MDSKRAQQSLDRSKRICKRLVVYVCGPISTGTKPIKQNIKDGDKIGRKIFKLGLIPLVPHKMNLGWEDSFTYEQFLTEFDFPLIRRCDALFRMPGKSAGADREVHYAMVCGIPVFHDVHGLIEWSNNTSEGKERSFHRELFGPIDTGFVIHKYPEFS